MKKKELIHGDASIELKKTQSNSISIVFTDPPYFLDKMDNKWDELKVQNKKNQKVIKHLPPGMKFDKNQGIDFYRWYIDIAKEIYRILKPGGIFFSFSSPRIYHRMACAIEDAGFEIRDMYSWIYIKSQPKAMSLLHFSIKLKITEEEKKHILEKINGWKTPQIKSCFEPICFAQKKIDKTYLNNFIKHDVSLINSNIKIGDNKFPTNVFSSNEIHEIFDKFFLVDKSTKKEKENE